MGKCVNISKQATAVVLIFQLLILIAIVASFTTTASFKRLYYIPSTDLTYGSPTFVNKELALGVFLLFYYCQRRIKNPLKLLQWSVFAKIANGLWPLTILEKLSMMDVSQSSKYFFQVVPNAGFNPGSNKCRA